jgi:SAM-dependent methyltransferase
VTAALGAQEGERILDVGCGPGFFVSELADGVGPEGSVVGIDASDEMLALAARRTEGQTNVTLLAGDATELPVADRAFDAALTVQVLEYVQDTPTALSELCRALVPGGRLVVWDIDWSTISWYSGDPERMRTMLDSWDGHLAHPALPQWLGPAMRSVGFVDVRVQGHAFVNTNAGPDTYSGGVIPLIESFVADHGISAAEAARWRSELHALSDERRYFFSVTQFCFTAFTPT